MTWKGGGQALLVALLMLAGGVFAAAAPGGGGCGGGDDAGPAGQAPGTGAPGPGVRAGEDGEDGLDGGSGEDGGADDEAEGGNGGEGGEPEVYPVRLPVNYTLDLTDPRGDVALLGNVTPGTPLPKGSGSLDIVACGSRFDGESLIITLETDEPPVVDDPGVRYIVEVHLDNQGDRRDQVVFSRGNSFISGWGGYHQVNHTWTGGEELKFIVPEETLGEHSGFNLSAYALEYMGNGTYAADFLPDDREWDGGDAPDLALDPAGEEPTNTTLDISLRYDVSSSDSRAEGKMMSFIFNLKGESSGASRLRAAYAIYVDGVMAVRTPFMYPAVLDPDHWGGFQLNNISGDWGRWSVKADFSTNMDDLYLAYKSARPDDPGGGGDDGEDGGDGTDGEDGADGDDGADGEDGGRGSVPGSRTTYRDLDVEVRVFVRAYDHTGEEGWNQVSFPETTEGRFLVEDEDGPVDPREVTLELNLPVTHTLDGAEYRITLTGVGNGTASISVGPDLDRGFSLLAREDMDSDGDGVDDVSLVLLDINGTRVEVRLYPMEVRAPPAAVDEGGALPGWGTAAGIAALVVICVLFALAALKTRR